MKQESIIEKDFWYILEKLFYLFSNAKFWSLILLWLGVSILIAYVLGDLKLSADTPNLLFTVAVISAYMPTLYIWLIGKDEDKQNE